MPTTAGSRSVRDHYEHHPYPHFPLAASVRPCDTYALNLRTLWARFNGTAIRDGRILIAGCGSFSPYPFAVANPDARITALDLSNANLRRARLHTLLHGRTNVSFIQGDILDAATAPGPFHFIDAFGVIHHLDDPTEGLLALQSRLAEGGILRLMVYGRQARREAQAIRTALRMLKIRDMAQLKRLLRRASPDSRLGRFLSESSEATYDSGLADALLHPLARTFTIDGFMELIGKTSLTPLLFAHPGALPDVSHEIERLRKLEKDRSADTNFILYLGLNPKGPHPLAGGTTIFLNPTLQSETSPFRLRTTVIPPRIGTPNPPLDRRTRRFLRTFTTGRTWETLTPQEQAEARRYIDSLFLVPGSGL